MYTTYPSMFFAISNRRICYLCITHSFVLVSHNLLRQKGSQRRLLPFFCYHHAVQIDNPSSHKQHKVNHQQPKNSIRDHSQFLNTEIMISARQNKKIGCELFAGKLPTAR